MMNEKIDLIKTTGTNASAKIAATNGTATTVFAERLPVNRSEFYQAIAAGVKPNEIFAVWSDEYDSQEYVGYGSDYYKVLRVYFTPDLKTQLTCVKL